MKGCSRIQKERRLSKGSLCFYGNRKDSTLERPPVPFECRVSSPKIRSSVSSTDGRHVRPDIPNTTGRPLELR